MSKPWQGKTVVIVDDSPTVRDTLKDAYEAVGMRVAGYAANGVEALEQVAKHNPELVSLDLIMPEMDGVECFKKLRKDFPDVRILVVTWLGSEQKIIDNLKDVIPSHLFQAKPLTGDILGPRLDRLYEMPVSASSPAPKPAEDEDMGPSALSGLTAKVG